MFRRDQDAEEELNEQMRKEIEEEKLKENELIPGGPDYGISDEGEREAEKAKRKKKEDDNPLIPFDDEPAPWLCPVVGVFHRTVGWLGDDLY